MGITGELVGCAPCCSLLFCPRFCSTVFSKLFHLSHPSTRSTRGFRPLLRLVSMEWPVPKTKDTSAIRTRGPRRSRRSFPLNGPPHLLLPQTRRHGDALILGTPGHSLPVGGGPHAQGMDGASGEGSSLDGGGAECGDEGDGRLIVI